MADEPDRASEPNSAPGEHRVRLRAYEIWVAEGKPDGRAIGHWLRAKWELREATDPAAERKRLEAEFDPGQNA
jgi:Protein of unknown function (DUF2934)